MRRIVVTLALGFVVIGCGLLPEPHDSSPSGAMAHMGYDIYPVAENGPNGACVPSEWVTGVIVRVEGGGVGIMADNGDVRRLTWGSRNPAVVDWDRRYTIGGREFTGPGTFWACGGADSVIPQ